MKLGLDAKGLEWVLHLLQGDCLFFFENKDYASFQYFRAEYRKVQDEYREVRDGVRSGDQGSD